MEKDVRWKQRYANYKKALVQFNQTSEFLIENRENNNKMLQKVSKEALIKCFEFTIELAWQTMRDFIFAKGGSEEIYGSRDTVRNAVQINLIESGQIWMDMIDDRNRAAHAYDENNATELTDRIINIYLNEFNVFDKKMGEIK